MRCRGQIAYLCAALALTAACQNIKEAIRLKGSSSSIAIQNVLTWLPADTETLIVANGPFWMSNFVVGGNQAFNREITAQDLEKYFQLWTLRGFAVLGKTIDRERVVLAAEGPRHFRSPRQLGLMPYEGCEIAVFAKDQSSHFDRFLQDSTVRGMKTEEIEGQRVAV